MEKETIFTETRLYDFRKSLISFRKALVNSVCMNINDFFIVLKINKPVILAFFRWRIQIKYRKGYRLLLLLPEVPHKILKQITFHACPHRVKNLLDKGGRVGQDHVSPGVRPETL